MGTVTSSKVTVPIEDHNHLEALQEDPTNYRGFLARLYQVAYSALDGVSATGSCEPVAAG